MVRLLVRLICNRAEALNCTDYLIANCMTGSKVRQISYLMMPFYKD
jgi:hypothetical protein